MTQAAIITGGAIRLGRSMAEHLARRGFDIAFTYQQSIREADSLREAIEANGRKALALQCDLTCPGDVDTLIQIVQKEFPQTSLLINNASIFQPAPIASTSREELQKNMAIHVESPFILSRDFAAAFKKGLIVNMLDQRVDSNEHSHAAYLLSKKTLSALTGMAATEMAPDIRVNALALGAILPPSDKEAGHETAKIGGIPAGRYGEVGDLLPALDLLIDNTFITGQTIYIDGGERL